MAVLFVSHSSLDDAEIGVLEAWLHANGFEDTFVDHQNLPGGAKWREELRASAGTCRVVVCLVTPNWLGSYECFNEFRAAWYMGKHIIPLFLLPPEPNFENEQKRRLAEVCAEDQGLDITPCRHPDRLLDFDADPGVAHRLKTGLRAAGALSRIGLDPAAFEIDRKVRPTPFPGLVSFGDEDADAALFYGRSREIADASEELRKMRAERDLRPFVIFGASGAGKSSLLKAGIVPRLRREAPAWLPLRVFRPGADPLLNFAEALAHTLSDFGRREAQGVIRDRLSAAWSAAERAGRALTPAGREALSDALEAEARALREAAARPGATILLGIDQAEEIARADCDSGDALADYMRVALTSTASRWQLAFTVRTDSFSELQSHRRFQGLEARGYDLRAMPAFRFDSVVEEPAKRYGIQVEAALVDSLMEDAPREDALPLLAFALQRLWRQYATSGALTKENYEKVGGLKGLIEDAAERALRGVSPEEDVALPASPPPKRRIDIAAATFVPALAQINEQGATIRRIAPWNSFDEEQQELLIRFDRWRLVVRKGDVDGGTVEVAHEALFREWARLKGWLAPERTRLEALRSLQTDALIWDRNSRDAVFLNHRDKRLSEANALAELDAYRKRFGSVELDYLARCRDTEATARAKARRAQALIYALAVGIIGIIVGGINHTYLERQWSWMVTTRPYAAVNVWPYVLTPQKESELKPLQPPFRECSATCPAMVVIPPGTFTMGASANEFGFVSNEAPQHTVTIAKSFAISQDDVTFDEWDLCTKYGDCPFASDGNYGRGTRPVINVSWNDAQHYVAWLSQITGKSYRMPTEAEWEYAARGGTTTTFYWGNQVGADNAACGGCGPTLKAPAPVGSYPPNSYHLYDMAGDVWQMVEDCWNESYVGAPTDGSAWLSGDCTQRVLRGGSWDYPPVGIRPAARVPQNMDYRDYYLGFRVARTLTP